MRRFSIVLVSILLSSQFVFALQEPPKNEVEKNSLTAVEKKEPVTRPEKTTSGSTEEKKLAPDPIFKMKTETAEIVHEYKSGSEYDNATIGVGMGIPYGFLGISGEITPLKFEYWHNFGIVAGFGIDNIVDKFWINGGLRYHFLTHEYPFRPRLTVFYGTNAFINIVDRGSNVRIKETFHGLNVGVGLQWMIDKDKRFGFDFDLVIVALSTIYDRLKELEDEKIIENADDETPGRIKISLGWRVAF